MAWIITSQTRFYLHEGETLLAGLLRTGHDVNFQCQAGYCGSCRVKLVSSSHPVTYTQHPLAMLEDNDILPCCCQVTGVLTIRTTSDHTLNDS
ncbi:class I ribonucleotide reductase maintenance protein YfaE [Psychrobacter sp. I-STPA6b]|uniref:class I ribonucleotide reductase maintenance protein YfaE n=1 Tax=Psychrobacter sp. I-STPA6b TaxID=2585718 RepID=UPI001D0C8AEF|nr:class I ribonucleotide reductase maintenance protein YfaE [Psychrobacter sp. I-STPA6b]